MSYLSNLDTGKYFQRRFVDKPFIVASAPNMYHISAAVSSICVQGTVFCDDVGSHLARIWSAAGSPTAGGREQGSGRPVSGLGPARAGRSSHRGTALGQSCSPGGFLIRPGRLPRVPPPLLLLYPPPTTFSADRQSHRGRCYLQHMHMHTLM